MSDHPVIRWTESGKDCSARWRSESDAPPAKRVVIADDSMTADHAYGLACQGVGLLWRGDFQNARQMSIALARRADRSLGQSVASREPGSSAEAFHFYRQARSQRARTLGSLLICLEEDYRVLLRRAPDVRQACTEVFGAGDGPSVISLRSLLGLIGAHEWRTNGVEVAAIGGCVANRGELHQVRLPELFPFRELTRDTRTLFGDRFAAVEANQKWPAGISRFVCHKLYL